MNQSCAKPFLKWAGGKSQLLEQFEGFFPVELENGEIEHYFEPFVGGGAVFFYIAQKYRDKIKTAHLYDVNEELILAYKVVQRNVSDLIDRLADYAGIYHHLPEASRKDFYYAIRNIYNEQRAKINFNRYAKNWVRRAAQLIFLNKTCYNGLFRVNRNGEFNVPFGTYKNPRILDEDNLLKIAVLLRNVDVGVLPFEKLEKKIRKNSFVYLDPPYRPISKTANFTSYSTFEFNDEQQIRLAKLFAALDSKWPDIKLMLSNSDPKNEDPSDDFFEKYYAKFHINRVSANRMINCDARKRGQINELIITNFDPILSKSG